MIILNIYQCLWLSNNFKKYIRQVFNLIFFLVFKKLRTFICSFFLKLNFDYALRLTNYVMPHVPFGYIRNKQKNKTIMKLFRIFRRLK